MTKKQLEEIDFLSKQWNINPTEEQKKEYLAQTVHGKSTGGQKGLNSLFQAKRRLDMTIKSWREDLAIGILGIEELKEDFNHPYMDKVLKGIAKGLRSDKRLTRITVKEYLSGNTTGILATVNRK